MTDKRLDRANTRTSYLKTKANPSINQNTNKDFVYNLICYLVIL